ncbi:23S rRNA (guanosine(2251)-2'-O)-methyltransferase RlmB [Parafannyhessea umbonata]|uniref:23S rRNA (Guanosine2251-2'-O)-methyltransferase n=1 Tax=Parafannyhessea umbonata TaxID=604330 RepID=A0A1H1NDF5_9ACTN|nr:23S rRNA (guanosine(2251)-2'-O)-methyltransferase RlmB [Parafannyhessea umbonata]SDR96439.1 23S rRNA (guanosine2251-2'-O)-methyltransferase [Parafannyhessea umbonata]
MSKMQPRSAGRPGRGGARGAGGHGSERAAGGRGERRGPRGAAGGRGQATRGPASRDNARKGGQRPKGQRPATDLIEGRRACAEALEGGLPLKRALVAMGGEQDQTLVSLVRRLEAAGVPVERVPKGRLDALSSHGAHQGIVVQTRPFAYAELSDVIANAGDGHALVVLLDHVTDEGNFGAIVRSAEVVGAAGVVIAKARAAGVGVGAYKTSAGAVLHVPIAQVSNLATAIDELKRAGFWVAGSTEHATQDVWSTPLEGRLCLVMGSEGSGISQLVRRKCDFECRLPQRGRVESLNVAQAATVMCYEWLRRESAAAAGVPAEGATPAGEL